jgi:hypothetical protein
MKIYSMMIVGVAIGFFFGWLGKHTETKTVSKTVVVRPVRAVGKPRFSGYIIAYPDGGYVGVPDPSLFATLKDRVKDKAVLKKFECWTNTNGKHSYDEYNSTEDWTYCKTKILAGTKK